jgi:hypothetical protein
MLPEYHQIEFDTRVYLTLLEHQSNKSHASKSKKQAD